MTTRGRVKTEQGTRRVRVVLDGETIADTTDPLLVWEKPYYPTYYVPLADVRTDLLVATDETRRSPSRGTANVHTVKTDRAEADGATLVYSESPIDEIAGHVRFDWHAMDAWFEEDEEVYVHPKDPYTRVDVLQSSRHVEVFVGGEKVADTHQPRFLFETGLPRRTYIPKTDVRMDLLHPTDTTTACPYKGTAEYYAVTVGGETRDDIVWWYRSPTAESQKIAGYVAFYDEKVDVMVDGVMQERPTTMFS